ncbi:histone-lysine N-methyltransferase EHMT1-like isoform X3 [Halichondria panicea]|uniref:histone-lysine N-methyltransferase EHMT1-like isoform X3 n=1 Tax=Halichondria panicea TaxID=6063 RepID=UPI00312B9519
MATAGQDSGLVPWIRKNQQLAVDLWEAVRHDDASEVRSLLEQGANPNHQLYWSEEWCDVLKKARRPPVHEACLIGNLEITRALVSGGADIDKGDGLLGMAAFHWACRGGHMETVVYLSHNVKCCIDVRNKWDQAPLHRACVGGSKQVVQHLVKECKVDVDVTDVGGNTPLDLTKLFVRTRSLSLTCPDVTDDLAVRSGHTEIVDYLQSLKPSTPEPVQQRETTATAAQLSSECSDEALFQLSTEIAGYNKFKHTLDLSRADIDEIDNDLRNFYSTQGKFYAALRKWKNKSIDFDNPSKPAATYGRLVEISTKIEDGEAVRSIHKACVEHTRLEVMDQSTPSDTTNTYRL